MLINRLKAGKPTERYIFPLQIGCKKGIISLRCGVTRCVGALLTCAGAWELALPCTAVILFSIRIIPYAHVHIKWDYAQIITTNFVQTMHMCISFTLAKSVVY